MSSSLLFALHDTLLLLQLSFAGLGGDDSSEDEDELSSDDDEDATSSSPTKPSSLYGTRPAAKKYAAACFLCSTPFANDRSRCDFVVHLMC